MLVSFHDLAKVELHEAAQYYERESRGLGETFVTEVERCSDVSAARATIRRSSGGGDAHTKSEGL